MNVLLVHNLYKNRGGEDSVVDAEYQMLSTCAKVQLYTSSNNSIDGMSNFELLKKTLWNSSGNRLIEEIFLDFKPDVVHVHNTFPLISPSIYWVADRFGIPLVQTIHNFRLHCPQAMYLRDGKVCEDCKGRLPWLATLRKCYRDSLAQSAVLSAMISTHRLIGSYKKVTKYIALNNFCRDKLIEGGLPAGRIVVKPNFIDDISVNQSHMRHGGLFVGRLSAEKGVYVLADAVKKSSVQVTVIGTGDLSAFSENEFGSNYLGFRDLPFILNRMRQASYLVLPSVWYECFPRTIVEAFASGLPVITSRLGALAEIVDDGRTGILFDPGDSNDLARKLSWANANPGEMLKMGRNARLEFEQKYTTDTNRHQLMSIYSDAISEKAQEYI